MPATPDPALQEQLRAALDATYEIEGELGGGMSRVFMATERALGRRVVIKVLPPELTAGVNRERFRREIQFAARLQHPHIVPLLTAGQVGDILYYTMPLVEGETLRSRLERERRLDAARVVAVLQDVVDALAYAHARGLIHRDIKPENILLQRHHALVTDFGVAKAISEALPGTAATTVGIAVGTPAYMAPEQLAADPDADHRIDLYAVGLLAYELLAGGSPFAGSSPQQTLARQLTERPTPPHIQRTDVPGALSALIMRCLEKEPSARWSSADELLQALNQVRITSSSFPAVTPVQGSGAPRPSSRRALLVGAGLVVMAAAAGAVALQRGKGEASAPIQTTLVPADTPNSITLPPAPPPSTLTRADSEAIAASVARRINQHRAEPTVGLTQRQLDSIRAAVQKSVTDSMMRMLADNRPVFRPDTYRIATGTSRGPGSPVTSIPVPLGAMVGPGGVTRLDNAVYRLTVRSITDRTADHSLTQTARALTDSLGTILGKRKGLKLLDIDAARAEARRTGSTTSWTTPLVTDGALHGSIDNRKDSLRLFLSLQDTWDPRAGRSEYFMAGRDDVAGLMQKAEPMVNAWLEERHNARRMIRIYEGTSRATVDSAIEQARRLRGIPGRRPPPKPDSAPPGNR